MSRKDLLEGKEPANFQQALYKAAHRMRGGVTALAAGMDVNYNTLSHKLNIFNESHYLYPDEVEQIALITEDPIIVESLARLMGLVVFKPAIMAVDNQALKVTGSVLADMSDFIKSLASGGDDDRWELNEVVELEKHGHALIKRLLGIMAGARSAFDKECNND